MSDTVFALVFLAPLLLSVYLINGRLEDISESLKAIAKDSVSRDEAYREAVEEGLVAQEAELQLGLYRPNEEDATGYLYDKIDELRSANFNPYQTWDWRSSDDDDEEQA